jgi:hypothetical protein
MGYLIQFPQITAIARLCATTLSNYVDMVFFLVCSKEGIKINAEAKDVNTNEDTSQLKQHCNVLMVR